MIQTAKPKVYLSAKYNIIIIPLMPRGMMMWLSFKAHSLRRVYMLFIITSTGTPVAAAPSERKTLGEPSSIVTLSGCWKPFDAL
jgi:hypothetical protein